MAHFSSARSRGVLVLATAAVLAVGAGSGAVAGSLITGKDIKNQSVEGKDLARGSVTTAKVKNKTLKLKDLSAEVTAKLGTQGPAGPKGATGAQGPQGASGTATYAGPSWSVIDRNTIGNATAGLRAGPSSQAFNDNYAPPLGVGSLGIHTGSGADFASFGNQVDFADVPLAGIANVSYWQYTTTENRDISATNLANVAMELNPNKAGLSSYSTLIFVPQAIPAGQWTKISTDTANWILTGSVGTATGCTGDTPCTLAQVKAAMPAATLHTVQITKGRDSAFTGAVDGLQIGSTTYDFEPFGVIAKTS